eukprot:Anaeramoba_ignava/a455_21.p1 GENE.a455_21~~a455_21.p1  ORF type:complete len:247 (+),score=-7.91 a455_21:1162-1902(+)
MNRREFLILSAVSPSFAKDFIQKDQDIYLSPKDLKTLRSLDKRLRKVRSFVGFGNFNFISFDEMLFYARNYSSIGKFTPEELALTEKLFYSNPNKFGFYGNKTVDYITNTINEKDLFKVPSSGHYIYKGKALNDYNRIIKDVGDNLILTSGVRNVVKQLSLYVAKIKMLEGNISKASTIIAPPAYSYHSISDFDIGKKGWGGKNFTSEFARTAEFYKMIKLDYINIRYTLNNKDGVRFEPWHVEVI